MSIENLMSKIVIGVDSQVIEKHYKDFHKMLQESMGYSKGYVFTMLDNVRAEYTYLYMSKNGVFRDINKLPNDSWFIFSINPRITKPDAINIVFNSELLKDYLNYYKIVDLPLDAFIDKAYKENKLILNGI